MKRLFWFILIFIIVLTGCKSAPESNENVSTPQPEPQSVTAETVTVVDDAADQTPKFIKTQTVDGVTYKSESDPLGYGFKISRITESGEQTLITDRDFLNDQLFDWQVCEDKLLISVNMQIFCYDLKSGSITDVDGYFPSYFKYYNGNVYFREHASRTFTIYKTKIGSYEKEVVLGHDVYDKENPKELIASFVITDSGEIVFCQRVPWGLYSYKNGKIKQITQSKEIDDSSLCNDGNTVYFVMLKENKKTLFSYDGKLKEICNLEDYKCNLYVQNGQYTYVSIENEIITKSLS